MVDPKFCNSVLYEIHSVHLKNSQGEVIENISKPGIRAQRIGQDTSLKDVIKQQQNKS